MRIWLAVVLALPQLAGAQVPHAAIANARIRAALYLPDAQSGYYRGTRFDWSGVVASLEWKGHTYFGQWFARYDPKLHDAIAKALASPDVKELFAAQGAEPFSDTPEQFAQHVRSEYVRFGKAVKDAGLKVE